MTTSFQNNTLKAILVALCMIGLSQATGQFSITCINKQLSKDGRQLVAHCATTVGQYVPTSIDINNFVVNRDGALNWASSKGEYVLSSRNFALINDHVLAANVRTTSGVYVLSSINLDEHIANINGVLTYQE